MISQDNWINEIEKILDQDPIFEKLGRDFIGVKSSGSSSKHTGKLLPVPNIKQPRDLYVVYGVPSNFRKIFVQLFEKAVEKSFVYWDDAKSSVDSIKKLVAWLGIDAQNFMTIVARANFESSEVSVNYAKILEILGGTQGYYQRVNLASLPGDYSVKGDVLELFPYGSSNVLRIEFFGDKVESIKEVDPLTRIAAKTFDEIVIPLPKNEVATVKGPDFMDKLYFRSINISSSKYKFAKNKVIVFADPGFDPQKLMLGTSQQYNFNYKNLETSDEQDFTKFIVEKLEGYRVSLVTTELAYLEENLPDNIKEKVEIFYGNLDKGLVFEDQENIFISDNEMFGILHPEAVTNQVSDHLEAFLEDIKPGDYVVHEDHGVGVFTSIDVNTITNEHGVSERKEYLLLTYLDADTLRIPIEQKARIIKYVGVDGLPPKLTRLDGKSWAITKRRIQKEVQEIAQDLVEIYAKRQTAIGDIYKGEDEDSKKLAESFEFILTEDQKKTYQEVLMDMESSRVMDRLLVGDVGFGKTEVALRAAFKAVRSGKQVALLAPTTVLANQHYEVFKKRLEPFNVNVEVLYRINTSVKNTEIIDRIKSGKVDAVIATHRLLSKDVDFKNLGLLIVDEEQRFGVKQKEKIKRLRGNLDVLMMSATPIPRTLHMALSGIRDISIIQTPPPGRLPIKTALDKFSWPGVMAAIEDELKRNGQVYFVHNKILTIDSMAETLRKLIPGIKVEVGHGQMSPKKLSQTIHDFKDHKFDVLVSTTIIENGLDMPNVNTIIVDEAENFGLAELYQLRGRVGRSKKQAYCYLMYRGKTQEFGELVVGKRSDYDRELEKNIMNIELSEKEKRERDVDSEPSRNPWKRMVDNRGFSSRFLAGKGKKRTEQAKKRLKAILESKELGSGFALSAKDLEIRGAGNLLGKEQHGAVSKVGLGLYMKILAQAVAAMRNEKEGVMG